MPQLKRPLGKDAGRGARVGTGDGCAGLRPLLPVEGWPGRWFPGLLRPWFCLFSLWPEQVSPLHPGLLASCPAERAEGRLAAVAVRRAREVNWGQEELCLLPRLPLFTGWIFPTSSNISGVQKRKQWLSLLSASVQFLKS